MTSSCHYSLEPTMAPLAAITVAPKVCFEDDPL